MKYPLFLMLILTLFACQPKDKSKQEANSATPATDTAEVAMSAPTTPDSAYLIVPGESIGRIRLGMFAPKLRDIMGQADSGDAAMGKSLQFWISKEGRQPRQYVAVYTVTNFDGTGSPPMVQQVQVTSPHFRTSSGLGSGSTLAEIRKEFSQMEPLAYYTNQKQQQVYIFDEQAQGIAFEITMPDSICTAVTVHAKGTDVTGTYLPVHPNMTQAKATLNPCF